MSVEKKNGRLSLATIALMAGIIGGPLAVWGESQLERGATKEKISQIEKRQEEDRRNTHKSLTKVDEKVERIDKNVVEIRILLESMKERGSR